MAPLPSPAFCAQLFAHGLITAEPWNPTEPADRSAVHDIICSADGLVRLDAPATAPPLDLDAAQWGLSLLAWSVSLLVDRSNTSTSLPQELVKSEPSGTLTCHHWSVDLGLRYLCDVLLRVKAAAAEDALVSELVNICSRWPLASVGAKIDWNEQRGAIVLGDDCLRRVLLDRIIQRRDLKLREVPAIARYIEQIAEPKGVSPG